MYFWKTAAVLLTAFFLLPSFSSSVHEPDPQGDDQKESPCCALRINSSPESVILLSSLDGKFSIIDAETGRVLWIRSTGPGPLLSSSISNLELTSDGKWFRLVPSLDGTLFRFTGDAVEALPFSAESLLESSFQVADDTIITGGKEVRTYGVGIITGKLHYVCTLRGCHTFEGPKDLNEDILVVKRNTQTVRAVNPVTGMERWNFSVGQHDVSLLSQPLDPEGSCQTDERPGDRKYSFCVAEPLREDSDENSPIFQFDVSKGRIFALSAFENRLLWEKQLDSPIVGAWMVKDGQLSSINLFPRDESLGVEEPRLFLGEHRGSPYIQLNKKLNGDWPFYRVDWRPMRLYLTSLPATHSKPVLISHERDESRALVEFHGPDKEYPYDGGFYVLSDYDYDSGESDFEHDDDIDFVNEPNTSPPKKHRFPVRKRPRRPTRGSTDKPDRNDTDHDLFDDFELEFWVYLHAMSYWWRELLFGCLLGAGVMGILQRWRYRARIQSLLETPLTPDTPSVPETPSTTSLGGDVVPVRENGTTARSITMNVQNVFVNIRHGPDAAEACSSESLTTDTEQRIKNRSSSETSWNSGPEFRSKFLHDFDSIEKIGKGGFGIVYKARHKLDGCDYAVKRIRLPNKKESRDKVMREVQALAKLDHPNIVRYFHTWVESPPPDWEFEPEKFASLDSTYGSHDPGESRVTGPTEGTHTSEPCNSQQDSNSSSGDGSSSSTEPDLNNAAIDQDDDSSFIQFGDPEDEGGEAEPEPVADRVDTSSCLSPKKLDSPPICDTNQRTVFQRRKIAVSLDQKSVVVNDLRVQVTSDQSACRALVPMNEFSDPRDVFRHLAESNCGARQPSIENFRKRSQSESSQGRSQRVFIYIQMQLCQKETLQNWLQAKEDRSGKIELFQMFSSIAHAVAYIHDQGLIHRDLKPSNIFFAPNGDLKVGDFGLVTAISEDVVSRMFPAVGDVTDGSGDGVNIGSSTSSKGGMVYTDQVGTELYMSPEQKARKPYDHTVDIYSLGLILFEFLVPFGTVMERYELIKNLKEKLEFPALFDENYSTERNLLRRMLSHDPKDRPSADEVLAEIFTQSDGRTRRPLSQSKSSHGF